MRSITESILLILILLPVYVLLRFILLRRKKIKVNLVRELFLCLFFICAIGIISLTVVPKLLIEADGSVTLLKAYTYHNRINVIPFRFIGDTIQNIKIGQWDYLIFNIFGNIASFAALGFLTPLLWKKFSSFKNVLLAGSLLSLSIELIQLPLYRGTDIDDILLNLLGAVIGFLLYKIHLQRTREATKLSESKPLCHHGRLGLQ